MAGLGRLESKKFCPRVVLEVGYWVEKIPMERSTLNQLEAALEAMRSDLSGRVEQLAEKSSKGFLSEDERAEYEQIVQLNDLMAIVKLQGEQVWRLEFNALERLQLRRTLMAQGWRP